MKFTTSDGLQIAFEDEGEGMPVLCLPGLTRNARDFDDLAAVISGVRIIRITYRGRGESDYDPEFMNYNVPRELKDSLELLDHLGVEKAVFIGTSRGGIIAMLAAAMAKDRMLGVVLNDIGPVVDDTGFGRILDYLGLKPKARNLEEVVIGLRKNMGEAFPDLDDADWLVQAKRWFTVGMDGLALNYDPKLRDAVIAQMDQPTPDLWPLFDAMQGLPLALIRGANTDLLSKETVDEMRKRRPDMIYTDVPNRGHVPFLNEAESLQAINALLLQVK